MRRKKINPTPAQLSPNEQAAMRFIEQYIQWKRYYGPTLREIATGVGMSLSATHDLVERLIAWDYLAWRSEKRQRRNLRVKRSISS